MFIEQRIFNKAHPDVSRLIDYGFVCRNGAYYYAQTIMNGDFRAEIRVSAQGEVSGKVFDLTTDEEYANIHIASHQGAFVNAVREAYAEILQHIAQQCFSKEYFTAPQANRLAAWILSRYAERPDFPWEKHPDFAVFRNPLNRKWYGLIIPVDKSKLDNKLRGKADVLNLKADAAQLERLTAEPGIYPAYHMNKKSWISIPLDDTLMDERLQTLLERSRQFALQGKGKTVRGASAEWIIPANPKYFDVEKAFRENHEITWKQSNNIAVGDVVYMYVAAPRSAILYKCAVTEVLIPYTKKHAHINIKHLMRIKLLRQYAPDLLPFGKLKEYGINAVRGPRNMPAALSRDIEKMTNEDAS